DEWSARNDVAVALGVLGYSKPRAPSMRPQIAVHRSHRMKSTRQPELQQALRPVPTYERAVREVSRMFSEAGIRHALVGALGANAYRNRPRTTEDIDFLVGDH